MSDFVAHGQSVARRSILGARKTVSGILDPSISHISSFVHLATGGGDEKMNSTHI
jgi:hypothetical protein